MAVGYCEESLLAEPILGQLSSATLSNQANRASSRSLSKISAFSIRVHQLTDNGLPYPFKVIPTFSISKKNSLK